LRYCDEEKNKWCGRIEFAVGCDVSVEFKKAVLEIAEEDWMVFKKRDGSGEQPETARQWAEEEQLTSGELRHGYPRWSHDGNKLLFVKEVTKGGHFQLFTMDVSDKSLKQLSYDPVDKTYPSWSPDGSPIAYVTVSSSGVLEDLSVINADGSHPNKLLDMERVYLPKWSPDGNEILFFRCSDQTCDCHIYTALLPN